MNTRVWGARLVLLLFFGGMMAPRVSAAAVCPRASAFDLILGLRDSCSALDPPPAGEEPIGVMEGDEAALQRILSLVHNNKEEYVAMLFYASWCPFSKICRPNFNILSSLFPSVHHFAFEESFIRPSVLSKYGVYGFPTLFLLNSTMRVRYHGSRTINSFVAFYNDITGINPTSPGLLPMEKIVDQSNLAEPKEDAEQEDCPFSWARSPEKLLQQDTYLALASSFVLVRLLYFLLPKLNACVKRAWMRHIRYASLMSLWDYFKAYLDQARQGFCMLNPCKRNSSREGSMNPKAWASLASVSIGEPSSGRAHFGSERR